MNVSGCRVGDSKRVPGSISNSDSHVYGRGFGVGGSRDHGVGHDPNIGRWPPNFLLSHSPDCGESCAEGCPVAELDRQSGGSTSRAGRPRSSQGPGEGWGMRNTGQEYEDDGGSSRFFPVFKYSAKPSTAEKSAGLEHRAKLKGGEATGRAEGSAALSSPRAGAGRTGRARNPHPTAKGLDLMSWLVRLVTPPEGVVLDPFLGSGTTGCAAVREGMSFIGCDLSEEYVEVSRDRIREWLGPLLWQTVERRGDANGPESADEP